MWYKEISADEVSADVTQDYSGQAVGIFTAAKMECHGYFNRADRNQHTVEVKILMPPKSGIFVTVVTPATTNQLQAVGGELRPILLSKK